MKTLLLAVAVVASSAACTGARSAAAADATTPETRRAELTSDTVKITQRGMAKVIVASAADERDPIICRNERPLGTRFRRQVCRRQSAINAERDRTQNMLNLRPHIQENRR